MLLKLLILIIWEYVTISNFYLLQSTACAHFTFRKSYDDTDASFFYQKSNWEYTFPTTWYHVTKHALSKFLYFKQPHIPISMLNTDVTEDFCKSNSSKFWSIVPQKYCTKTLWIALVTLYFANSYITLSPT